MCIYIYIYIYSRGDAAVSKHLPAAAVGESSVKYSISN